MKISVTILVFLVLSSLKLIAQTKTAVVSDSLHGYNFNSDPIKQNQKIKYYQYCIDSLHGRKLFLFIRDGGSIEGVSMRKYPTQNVMLNAIKVPTKSFLKIHGNVLYDLNYYSNIDTPYNQQNVYQHTVQAYFDITVKDHYPIRLYITNRFGNSLWFKKFTDVNLLYTSNIFIQNIKEQLKKKMIESIQKSLLLDSLKKALDLKYKELDALKAWQTNPATLQKMVEAREQEFFKKTKTSLNDSLLNTSPSISKGTLSIPVINMILDSSKKWIGYDSLEVKNDSLLRMYETKKKQFDSLSQEVSVLEKKYNQLKEKFTNVSGVTAKEIDAIKNPRELQDKLLQLNIDDSSLPKGYKTFMALRKVGIGRNIINYSELSVNNISVTGVQVEYNPSYYVAFAAGTVDYRFRDFIVQNYNQPKQYVGVARVGLGMKDGNNVIFTYYAGRKQLYNSFTDTLSENARVVSPYLMGFTVESNYKIGNNNLLTAEIAKSSIPYYITNNKSDGLFSSTIKLNDHSNEAYSIKLASYIPATKTTVNGYYKHFGINFQSYSIFTNGSSQSAFNIRVEQPFFKRTLDVVASINANDFTNPYIPHGYKSSTVFKSIQATFRKEHLPVISLGYFPSSQLTKLNDDQYIQNLFYTLVGSASHFYQFHTTMYSTTFLYTQFYNKPKDTGFVYFNTKNILLNQSIFLNKFTLQFNGSEALNPDYRLYEAGGNVQFKWNSWLSIGGGLKYNAQTVYNIIHIGYSANATIKIPLLGEFMLMVDRGFIPGPNRQLVSNDVGRFTYFKSF